MKKNIIICAIASLALTACGNDPGDFHEGGESGGTFFTFTSGQLQVTKTAFDGIAGLSWATGDLIGISMEEAGGTITNKVYSANAEGRTDGKAVFNNYPDPAQGLQHTGAESYNFYAHYPARTGFEMGSNHRVTVEVPAMQSQAGRTTAHLGQYNILCADPISNVQAAGAGEIETGEGQVIDLKFYPVMPILEFRIAAGDANWQGAGILSVEVHRYDGSPYMSGQANMALHNAYGTPLFADIAYVSGQGSSSATVTITGDGNVIPDFTSFPAVGAAADDSVFPVYMTVYPWEFGLERSLQLIITTTAGTYSARRTAPAEFAKGKKYVMNVTLTGTPT